MTEYTDDTPNDERLADVENVLRASRAVPSAKFRGELRRHLVGNPLANRPRRVRFLIATYAASGAALLLVVTIGIAGVGPLAA